MRNTGLKGQWGGGGFSLNYRRVFLRGFFCCVGVSGLTGFINVRCGIFCDFFFNLL